MKSHVLHLAAATFGAFCAHFLAGAPADPLVAFREQPPVLNSLSELVRLGTVRRDVESLIGAPGDRLSRDVWVYWNFKTTDEDTNRRGYDTLLITFVDDRVVNLKVVSSGPVKQFLALQRQRLERSRVAGSR